MKTAVKRCFSVLLAVVLLCQAARAIEPRQLISPFSSEEEHVTLGGADLQALLKDDARPLGQIAAKIVMPLVREGTLQPSVKECVERMGAFAIHIGKADDGRRDSVFAAEVAGELPPAPDDAGFAIENVPDGSALVPVGIYTLNDQKVYCAFLSRDGQNFIIAAGEDPALLSVMAAVPADVQAEAPRTGYPLWLNGYTPPSRLSKVLKKDILPQALQMPLRYEVGLDQTDSSIRAHVWSNLNEFFASDDFPAARERPVLIGSDSLYGLLSFEGFAGALTPHQDKLEQAAAAVGLSPDDLASVLSGRVTIGAAGKSSSLIGSFPGFYIHLSGADRAVAEKLLALVSAAASRKTSKTEEFRLGKWHGVRMTRWAMLSACAAASDQGFVLALLNSSELERTPRPAPEISRMLAENHRFQLCLDAQALMNKLDSALGTLGSLFMSDEQQHQMGSAFKLMEAFGVFTLTA
ncbi:MAG: hypothetical protein J6Z30_05295, partial [Pyramidobacter sp.]|nr:hypothetical protein [Pyramidobacter sp.]